MSARSPPGAPGPNAILDGRDSATRRRPEGAAHALYLRVDHGPGAVPTGFNWDFPSYLDVNGRGTGYYAFYTSAKHLGAATFYLMLSKDKSGNLLDGGKKYKMSLLKDVPAEHFWSVIAYNSADGAWFENQPKAGVASSDKGLKVNADGTIDVFFGPKMQGGQEANSVPTTLDTNYWLYFRFYGPKPAVFTKTWQLPDLEEVKSETTKGARP